MLLFNNNSNTNFHPILWTCVRIYVFFIIKFELILLIKIIMINKMINKITSLIIIIYNMDNNIHTIIIYNDNVSLELVYVGWNFGDHCDNSKAILDYNLS
jgi:hypothetical protein